jgi:serine/threonine-protein kinase RsbW
MSKIQSADFYIENQIKKLPGLVDQIEELAAKWELNHTVIMNIHLALEEALSNIIYYGFRDEAKHRIEVSLTLSETDITIVITDDGIPFDPTSVQLPDLSDPVEERHIGGLGIFLISQVMDSIHYSRNNNLNTLTLRKSLDEEV